MSADAASVCSADMTEAIVGSYLDSVRRMPPAMKQQPRTYNVSARETYPVQGYNHKQDVHENTSKNAGLYQSKLVFLQRNDADYKLDCVAKCCIEQASNMRSYSLRELFCGEAQQCSQRHDGEEIEHKDSPRRQIQCSGDDAHRHKHEQDIDIAALQHCPGRAKKAAWSQSTPEAVGATGLLSVWCFGVSAGAVVARARNVVKQAMSFAIANTMGVRLSSDKHIEAVPDL